MLENGDTAFAETFSVSWWRGSAIVGSETTLIPAGGEWPFFMGALPDGLEIDALAWPAQGGGNVYETPDYRRWKVFHVRYPNRATFGEVPAQW